MVTYRRPNKIVMGRFNATTFDELFEQTKSLPWETVIDKEGNFPVQGRSVKSTLYRYLTAAN